MSAGGEPPHEVPPGQLREAGGTAYLYARLDVIESRVRRALAEREKPQASDSQVPPALVWDPRAGEHTDEHTATIRQGLATAEAIAIALDAAGIRVRLRSLARACALTELDTELLLIALGPELDPRFGLFYSYLHDDLARPRASIGLAFELCGTTCLDPAHRARLVPGAPLLACGLLTVTDEDQPFPVRTLRAQDRVAGHLLGDDELDPLLTGSARYLGSAERPAGSGARAAAERLSALLASEAARSSALVYLRGSTDSAVVDVATAAAAEAACAGGADGGVVLVDLARLTSDDETQQVLRSAAREARLRECGLVVGPVDRFPPDPAQRARLLRHLADLPAPAVLFGPGPWDARWSDSPVVQTAAASPGQDERDHWWRHAMGRLPGGHPDAAAALSAYRLAPSQMRVTVEAALAQARAEQRGVTTEDLRRSARRHNAADLEQLASRVEPSATWDDLVLAETPIGQLRELADRHRHRGTVLADWRLRPAHGIAGKVAALFTGESGTGKTLAAEVLAAAAGIDLYVVNLATVVDKYIGETQKNLERIFTAAAGVQGMLFFDEADALFGKRSKVSDAHDRFANIETAYLLQRLETFDGLAILATNLSGNVDRAFLRRLDAIIHFPRPSAAERLRLWDLCLGPSVPRSRGLDLATVAAAFDLTGGSIRSCALTAAYQAAATGRPVSLPAIYAAVRHEYRKLGRVIDESEFPGPLYANGSGRGEDVVASGEGGHSRLG